MNLTEKKLKIMKWIARGIALFSIIVGLPIYFGYGNPFPFAFSNYNFYDNLWRTVFPFMFIGLGLGWKWEKLGGYLTIIGILTRLIVCIITKDGISLHIGIPLIAGILYLIVGYNKNED